MKKNVRIGLIVLIVVAILMSIIIMLVTRKDKQIVQIKSIGDVNYMLIMDDNKYGIINRDGDIVVEAVYDEVSIPNPAIPLFICMYGYNDANGEYMIKVLNESNEQILYQFYRVEAIELAWSSSEFPFEKSVLKYKQNGKYGLIDFDGNIILKAKYDEIESIECQEGLLLVKNNGKYGVININGDIVVQEKYDSIKTSLNFSDNNYVENARFIVGNYVDGECKYGYVNYTGKVIVPPEYEQIEIVKSSDNIAYSIVVNNDKVGVYKEGQNIIQLVNDNVIYNENNNCFIVEHDNKQGIMDKDGNVALPIQYDYIFISGKYINTRTEDTIEIYDYSTMEKINIENSIGLNEIVGSEYAIAITNDEKYKVYDLANSRMKEYEYDYLECLEDGKFIACKDEKFGVIDIDGKIIVDFKYDYVSKNTTEKIIKAQIKDENNIRYEYVDFNGDKVDYVGFQSKYPNNIGGFAKCDLGYGQPYYIVEK